MFQSRTHTCGELRLEHVGQKVKIVGWMENVREVGSNFAFVVVRDFYGTTQVVVETAEMMAAFKAINKESTISVEGVVRERASKNPKLPTGDIEIVPEKVEVLGRCRYNELPFEINRSREADEAQRLKYRYLDLDPDGLLARGRARLSGPRPQAPRQVLRPAAGAAAVQAAADDLGL